MPNSFCGGIIEKQIELLYSPLDLYMATCNKTYISFLPHKDNMNTNTVGNKKELYKVYKFTSCKI